MQCPKCHEIISDQSQFCSHCGAQVQSASAMDPIHTHIPGLMDPPVIPDGPYVPETETEVKESLAMGFIENFKYNFLKRYISVEGRASRNEYLKFAAIATMINIIAEIISNVENYFILSSSYGVVSFFCTVISWVLTIGVLIPMTTVCIRRLHDVNRSGWWVLIQLIPLVQFVLLFFTLKGNQIKENQYGKPVHYYVLTEKESQQLGIPRNDATLGTIISIAIIIVLAGINTMM